MNDFEAYLGTAMNVILTKMKDEGKDVINLGLGDPDVIPPEHMRQSLSEACFDPDNHHYPSFYSPLPLKESISGWYERQYGVRCDPETEVLPLLGSADGLFHIHTCLLDAGDTALVPDPCYPAYIAGVKIAGGVIETVPLLKENISKDWCFKVLDEIAVWMIPGSMYGQYGEGYFRIALTHPAERLAEAMDRLNGYLAG